MNKLYSFVAILVFVFACDSVEWDEPEIDSTFCLSDRQTVEVVKDLSGIMIKSGENYLIESNSSTNVMIFAPCNLPSAFMQPNIPVVFSGKQKEILANEKWAGVPLELIKIKKGSGI